MPRPPVAVPDRKQQIRDLVSGRDLLPEKFVEIAFEQEDVDRVDLFRFSKGSWTPSKIDDFRPGFDPKTVTSYILDKYGPGRYRLSVVGEGEYLIHRSYAVGELDEPKPHGRTGDDLSGVLYDVHGNPIKTGTNDPNAIAKDLADNLRTQTLIRQHADILAESDSRSLEREVKPAQIMMQTMTSMMDAFKQMALNPPKQADPLAVMLPVILKMMDSQQAIFLAMLDQKNKGGDGSSLKQVADALGVLEKTLTGRIGELIQGQDSDRVDWAKVAEVASPMLERALGVIELSLQRTAPAPATRRFVPATPLPAGTPPAEKPAATPAPPTTPAAETPSTQEDTMRLHEDPEIDKALHEAATLGVEMLKSRDFHSFRSLIELNFPDFLERVDLEANPLIYIGWLKRLDPGFDQLRSEFTDFMKWLGEQDQPEQETAS